MNRLYILAIVLGLFIFSCAKAIAQQTPSMLILTPFTSDAQFEEIQTYSSRILDFYTEEPRLVLSLTSQPDMEQLTRRGLKVEILDRDADISRYVYLYHKTPNQASRLSGLGEIFAITPYHTLLKLPQEAIFRHEGAASEFFVLAFPETFVSSPTGKKQDVSSVAVPALQPSASRFQPLLLFVIGALAGGITAWWLRGRRQMNMLKPTS